MSGRARLLVGFFNQGVLSLGTLLFVVFAARGYSSADLGLFAIGCLTYQIFITVIRALSGETLIVMPNPGRKGLRLEAQRCLQFAGTIPLVFVPLGIVGVVALDGTLQVISAALIVVPGFVLQDAFRHVLLRRQQVVAACLIDVAVVGSQLIIVWFGANSAAPPWVLILFAGVPPFIIGYVRSFAERAGLSIGGARAWRADSKELSDGFAFEAMLGALVQWLTLLAVAHFASLAEAGAFRAIITLYGVTNVVTNFLRSHYLAQLARKSISTNAQVWKSIGEMAALSTLTVACSYFVLSALPDSIGIELLGDTWTLAVPYLLLGAISRWCAGLTVIPTVMLRVLRMPWNAARTRVVISIITLIVAPGSVAIGGAKLGFIGMSCMSIVMVIALSRVVLIGIRDERGGKSADA